MKKRILLTILFALLFSSLTVYAAGAEADFETKASYDYDYEYEEEEEEVCPPHEWHYLEYNPATFTEDAIEAWDCGLCGIRKTGIHHYRVSNVKLVTTQFKYNGKSQKPKVIVRDSQNNDLKLNVNYKLTYSKDTKSIGKHEVKVVLIGGEDFDYKGTKTLTYTIVPTSISIKRLSGIKKGFSVSWGKNSQATGYQINYSESSKMTKAKTVTVGKKTFSRTIRSLKSKKRYYVRVRTYKTVSGKRYYSAWSSIKSVKTK